MKISYNWLQKYFDKPLPTPEKISELLSVHAFEVESVEKMSHDTILDVKVLPDRAHYALSHRGVASEVGAILERKIVEKKAKEITIDKTVGIQQIDVKEEKLCRRYIARKINNLKVTESPTALKEKLEAIGARSINSVVDATNFVMFDIGQPLHAFDADKVKGSIIVRLANVGEKMTLLDGREVELKDTDLLIADEEGPLVIAGVKGGKRAEVTYETKNIIIESANFDPTSVRRTSTRLNIRNDSSKRFENDLTPQIALVAMEEVTALIMETSSGEVGHINDIYPLPAKQWTVEVDTSEINSITGLNLKVSDMKDILERLLCGVVVKGSVLYVTPPFIRQDLLIKEDIADEIVRIYGYDKLKAIQTPKVDLTPVDKTFYYTEKIKTILIELGFSEAITYSLVSKGVFEISYPLASDKSALRENISLTNSTLTNARSADLLGLEAIKIFEVGNVFAKAGEKTVLSIAVSQLKKKKGVDSNSILVGATERLAKELGIEINDKPANITGDVSGSRIQIDLSDLVSKLPSPGLMKDLDFTVLSRDIKYKPFSAFPYIVRDIAFFAPLGIVESKARAIIDNTARACARDLLIKGPDLFDKFEKGDKVSFGYRLIFQSFDRTLSDEEVNSFMEIVYRAVRENGWEVR